MNIIIILLIIITAAAGYFIKKASKRIATVDDEVFELSTLSRSLYIISAILLTALVCTFVAGKLTWESHLIEWLTLLIRWAHVVLGIAWIGASFYFIFLENSLNRTENLRDELAGNLWAIHGGGFYYLEKYKSAPKKLPKTLHWFKYEAYFTWLTGFVLLTLVYYMNAKAYMTDPAVSDITSDEAIYIGLASLISGWLIYDILCRTSLLQKKKLFAVIGFTILTGISFILSRYLSGRAAFMHVGALLGTIMVGNVFFVIIPAQKAMVAAAKKGVAVNPELGKYAGLRSLHNNYMTLPVIFVMISNHFPLTFGHAFNWIILALLTLGSVAVRHYINLHEKGIYAKWMLPFAAVALLALVIITAPENKNKKLPPVNFSEVQPIFQKRCISCHSSHPTDDTQKIAPNGIMFDT
ncbi:MAG: urate hydroxylase PuuD, partial [Bacteroidota bacterium]